MRKIDTLSGKDRERYYSELMNQIDKVMQKLLKKRCRDEIRKIEKFMGTLDFCDSQWDSL